MNSQHREFSSLAEHCATVISSTKSVGTLYVVVTTFLFFFFFFFFFLFFSVFHIPVAFLDVLNRMKVEMLAAVDARVAQCMPAQLQLPVTGNCTRIAAPIMAMAGPAPYVTQGMQGYHYPIAMQSGQP